jgi:hypothetical protein
MATPAEVILATLAGAADDQRLEIALCHVPGEGSRLEMRQQSWGEGIGWFTQSRVELEPHQVAELRAVLGTASARPAAANRVRQKLPKAFSQVSPGAFKPRVVHADSA